MSLKHQIEYSERKRKGVLNAAQGKSKDGVALTSIAHPKGPRIRKRIAISKAATDTVIMTVKDGKVTAVEKPLVLRLKVSLVSRIDAAQRERGLKSRSEMIRLLLEEALAK